MKHLRIRKTSDQGPSTSTPAHPWLSLRRASLDPSADPTLFRRQRRVSVANENPTRHLASFSLPTQGSSSLLNAAGTGGGGLSGRGGGLEEAGWTGGGLEPAARPTRSSLPHIGFSARNDDWNSVQQSVLSMFRREKIEPQQLVILGARVGELSKSEIGPFIYDYYKNQLLMKGMRQMREGIRKNIAGGNGELEALGEAWDYFYREILPLLHYILHRIATKDLSIKQATLVAFRDNVLLRFEIEDSLRKLQEDVPPNIQQMLLVLQSVPLKSPPGEEYLKLETLVALVVNPYLGYRGLYTGAAKPAVSAYRTESTKRKKSTTQVTRGRTLTKPNPIPTILVNEPMSEPHANRLAERGLLTVGRLYSQPAMSGSTLSLAPVVEKHEGVQEYRRHSFSMV